jgi:hypothetical protein
MVMDKDCDCETCRRINGLVEEIGEALDGHNIKDIMLAFASILSNIGENLPVDNREFAAEFYSGLITMMEDNDNGNRTYN